MKLSEAIMLGSLGTTQAFNEQGRGTELCVIQTALYAIGESTVPPHAYVTLWRTWPWTNDAKVIHPVTGKRDYITYVLYTLNDRCRWPRPLIAEWVRTVEPSEVEQPITEEVLHEVI